MLRSENENKILELATKCGLISPFSDEFYAKAPEFLPNLNEKLSKLVKFAEAIDNESKTNSDCTCICKGNWRLLVSEYEDLFNRKYMDSKGKVWKFFGLVHSADDYYYGMSSAGKTQLLSCVGHIEGFGYTLIEDSNEVNEC